MGISDVTVRLMEHCALDAINDGLDLASHGQPSDVSTAPDIAQPRPSRDPCVGADLAVSQSGLIPSPSRHDFNKFN
jgi:hypothetical protein